VWFFSKDEQLQSAQVEIDAAASALEQAQSNLDSIEQRVASANFLEIEQTLANVPHRFPGCQNRPRSHQRRIRRDESARRRPNRL
jgi:hypothetical protein